MSDENRFERIKQLNNSQQHG